MTKITDQDIPDALVALFGAYVAKGKASQGASGTNRARKRVKKRPHPKKPNPYHVALWALAQLIAANYRTRNKNTDLKAVALDCWRLSKRGQFPPKYWDTPTHTGTTYHRTAPTSVERFVRNPYAYPDPYNRPTVPTYPNAAPSVAPARYAGATAAQLFADTELIYRRDSFTIDPPITPDAAMRIVTITTGTTTAAASTRGARPLLALVIHAQIGALSVPPITDTPPPMGKGRAIYPRYKRPKDTAPYYNAAVNFNITRLHNPTKADPLPQQYERITIDTAPSPAMGYRYNNNTTINTSLALSANPIARLPMPPLPPLPMLFSQTPPLAYLSPFTGNRIEVDPDQFAGYALPFGNRSRSYAASLITALWDERGQQVGTIDQNDPNYLTSYEPVNAPWGWYSVLVRSAFVTPHQIIKLYNSSGTLIDEHGADSGPYENWIMGYVPIRVSANFQNHYDAIPNTIMDFLAPRALWYPNGPGAGGKAICSADAIYWITPAGDLYQNPYPTTRTEEGGYQGYLPLNFIANIGYYPTSIMPSHEGCITWSAAQGVRHVKPDATWDQYALSTVETPVNAKSFGYTFD